MSRGQVALSVGISVIVVSYLAVRIVCLLQPWYCFPGSAQRPMVDVGLDARVKEVLGLYVQ